MSSGTFYPAASGDDGYWDNNDFYGSNDSLYLGWGSYGGYRTFIRFPNVTIPAYATIDNVFVRFTAHTDRTGTVSNVRISLNDVDNAVAPINTTEADSLVLTTNNTDWNAMAAWSDGNTYDSAAFISAFQEVVDRGGWSSGNAITVILKDNASDSGANRFASSFDYLSGAEKAELHVTWTEWEGGITLPVPFSTTTSLQSNIQVEVVHGTLGATSSMSIGEIYSGKLIECPSPFSVQSSLQSAPQIEITEAPFISNNSLQSKVEVSLSNILFTSMSSMSIDDIFRGYLIGYPSPMSAQSSLQSAPQIEVNQSLFTSTGSLYVQPEIQLFTGSLPSTGSISATIIDPFSVAILPRVYTFTLTGAADGVDDIVIPIKSFQSRLKNIAWGQSVLQGDYGRYAYTWHTEQTYLSIVIPGMDYSEQINNRLSGKLVLRMGYDQNGTIIIQTIIAETDFDDIVIYNGPTNESITLQGYGTKLITGGTQEINLSGSSYRNITAGKLRYRCTPNLYVRPGDTVNIDNDSFIIENITYSVSPELETFEVSE